MGNCSWYACCLCRCENIFFYLASAWAAVAGMLVACVGVICTLAGTRRAGMLVVFAGVYRLFLIQRPG